MICFFFLSFLRKQTKVCPEGENKQNRSIVSLRSYQLIECVPLAVNYAFAFLFDFNGILHLKNFSFSGKLLIFLMENMRQTTITTTTTTKIPKAQKSQVPTKFECVEICRCVFSPFFSSWTDENLNRHLQWIQTF